MKNKTSPKNIVVLGSTGSIGRQTLDIVRNKKPIFNVKAISCHNNTRDLKRQIEELNPIAAAITGTDHAIEKIINTDTTRFYYGSDGLCEMIRTIEADIIVNGIAGSAGLLPSFAAIESGKNLALANKETIVMAGPLILEKAKSRNLRIIPVDSEHSAIFHLLRGLPGRHLDQIILTASGGAFRDLDHEALRRVTVADALKHPNWNMGKKITIDSATMANKALEVIEACHLFGLPPDKIRVLIHPQSCVHSLIRTVDGTLYAQISKPDMHIPIQNALTYPDLEDVGYGRLDLSNSTLQFFPVDEKKYPLLAIGYQAASSGGVSPIVFNAANEIAVDAFIQGRISFLDISRIVEKTLAHPWPNLNSSLDDVIFIDKQARIKADLFVKETR
jgi:1-deoxy-D-xylulose-5-phosphate reductoisomerase